MSTPTSDRAFIERSVRRGIVGAAVIVVLLALLWVLKSALTPLATAFVLAYLLDPVIDRFEAHRVPRPIAIFVLLGIWFVGVLVLSLLLVPRLSSEIAGLGERLPGYVDGALGAVAPRLHGWLGISIPASIREGVEGLSAGELALPVEGLRKVLQRLLQSLTGTLGAIVGLLVIPVLTYYTLVEFDRIKSWFLGLVPPRYQGRVSERAQQINELVASFLRGQLIVCAVLGVLYAIGFTAIGIDLAIWIGLVAGALSIIPYVGSAVALAIAASMSLLQYGVDVHVVLVIGWYALVQTLEGLVLTPRIVGESVGIHPVGVIVALLIGGDLLGFLGLLVAVPVAAVVQVFARELLDLYRESDIYAAG